jgi:ubiquinone/menaquinone biosynthesis C-methylase UbiE
MGLYSKHIFPRILDWSLRAPDVQKLRGVTLAGARGDVVEIGFGTGLNLRHYPSSVVSLAAVDAERMLTGRVDRRIRNASMQVEFMQLDASGRLPFADASFDCAVTTFTLCSIADVSSALAEIRRVLKPEGRYLFLEHGRSDDPRVARRQDFFNPLQKIVACGCNINRPIDRLVAQSGLELVELHRFLMAGVPRITGEMYRGMARSKQ